MQHIFPNKHGQIHTSFALPKDKCFQLKEGGSFAPYPLTRGNTSGPRCGFAPRSSYRLALHARHMSSALSWGSSDIYAHGPRRRVAVFCCCVA